MQSHRLSTSLPFFQMISKEFSLFLSLLIPLMGWVLVREDIWLVALVAGTTAYVSAKWVKGLIGRQRPQEVTRTTFRIDQESSSFPSRHVAVLMAECMVLILNQSEWSLLWMIATFLVAISRIILREHYVSDIFAGISLGVLAGLTVELIKGVLTA